MPYRRTESVEARLTDNRARILAAARAQVSDGGWEQTQVASIAAAAGMATGTVYRYFPSKAELFAEVVAEVSRQELDVMSAIAATDDPPAERLHAAVAAFVKRAMRNPQLAYSLIAEPCDKAIDEERLKWRAAISRAVMAVVQDGQRRGEFRADVPPEVAATMIVGGFMEGLVGPLSPLQSRPAASASARQQRTRALAGQIASLCTASLRPERAAGARVVPLPASRTKKP
jgi:AcrR family transcriptional regulator